MSQVNITREYNHVLAYLALALLVNDQIYDLCIILQNLSKERSTCKVKVEKLKLYVYSPTITYQVHALQTLQLTSQIIGFKSTANR